MSELILSPHFSWQDVTASSTGARLRINNSLPYALMSTAVNTAALMEQVRALLGHGIHVDSWYRCPILNSTIGSKSSSQHVLGEAVDFVCPEFGTPDQICRAIAKSHIVFDQLIMEHTWVHISKKSDPALANRRSILILNSDRTYSKANYELQ